MEFRYISKVTGDGRWQEAADKALDVVLKAAEASDRRGLVPPGGSKGGRKGRGVSAPSQRRSADATWKLGVDRVDL